MRGTLARQDVMQEDELLQEQVAYYRSRASTTSGSLGKVGMIEDLLIATSGLARWLSLKRLSGGPWLRAMFSNSYAGLAFWRGGLASSTTTSLPSAAHHK